MKQLHALYFRLLPLAAHFDYFKKLSDTLAAASDPVKAALAALLIDFNTWLAKEDAVLRWVIKSTLTEQIAEADRQVDALLVGINALLTATLHSPHPEEVAAAVRIQTMLKSYGRVAHKSYNEEAGAVRVILEQFTGAYAADVASVGLTTWVTELQAAFNHFEDLLRQRETEQGEKPPYTTKEVRKGIEEVYQQMVRIIDAGGIMGTATADFVALIDLLNPTIAYLNEEFHHAKKDLGAGEHTVVEPIDTQAYTENPVTVIPKVHYREDGKETRTLSLGKDFDVSYKNNVHVGTAEVIIHGKGVYKGQFVVTFNIAR